MLKSTKNLVYKMSIKHVLLSQTLSVKVEYKTILNKINIHMLYFIMQLIRMPCLVERVGPKK